MRRYRLLPRTWSKSGGWRRRLPAVITSEVRFSILKQTFKSAVLQPSSSGIGWRMVASEHPACRRGTQSWRSARASGSLKVTKWRKWKDPRFHAVGVSFPFLQSHTMWRAFQSNWKRSRGR
jgi:hypothetical protein